MADELCRNPEGRGFRSVCLRPHPGDNTRTDARAVARVAAELGWQRLIVVTHELPRNPFPDALRAVLLRDGTGRGPGCPTFP